MAENYLVMEELGSASHLPLREWQLINLFQVGALEKCSKHWIVTRARRLRLNMYETTNANMHNLLTHLDRPRR